MYIWISISFLWYKAQQCVEQIAKDDMCFEVKNSNLTFCVFKNSGRFASISFISHYFLYYKKAAENWYVCIFIFRTILFKRNLYIYIGHMVVSGDLQCRICCELIKSKILLLYIIFGYFICKSLLISTKDCVTSVVTGCYENDNI